MHHFRSAHAAASSDAWSTVIDGADQAQYGLPYFAQDDKSTTNGLKYKVWFVGKTVCMVTTKCATTLLPFVCAGYSDSSVRCSCSWGVCQCLSFQWEYARGNERRGGGDTQVLMFIFSAHVPSGPASTTLCALFAQHCRTLLAYIDKHRKLPGTWVLYS